MQSKVGTVVVALLAVLILGIGIAGAFSPREAAAPLDGSIFYQGRLAAGNGAAVNGAVTMRFQVYDAATGGTALWDSGDLSVQVNAGIFSVELNVSQSDFSGQGLWLQVAVEGELLSPREKLAATPYALGLRPGAVVERSTDGDGLTVRNQATGFALRGESAKGSGVYGYSEDNYAVYGFDGGTTQARGYGGYFYSENGVGVYGRSNGESNAQNLWAPGVYGRSTNGVGVYGRTGSTLTYMAAVRGENDGFGYGGYFSAENGLPLMIIRNNGVGNLFEAWVLNPVNRIFRINTSGNVYADGTYNSPAADFAELLPARPGLEAGDVLVIGPDGQIARSAEAYQSAVVGVYSTQPGFLGGQSQDGNTEGKVPVAVMGVVPVKVVAENGPIQPGDLLTASSTPGHAMRCQGAERCFGRTIGKALEGLEGEFGLISMLVVLH